MSDTETECACHEAANRLRHVSRGGGGKIEWMERLADQIDTAVHVLLTERDAARAEVALLRAAWLRAIQEENACLATGKPCRVAKRCGCEAEQAMLIREAKNVR